MKHLITISTLIGYLTVALFSFGFMAYASDDALACMASLINNAQAPCPASDPFGFAGFHNDAAQKISVFNLVDGVVLLYYLLFGLVYAGLILFIYPAPAVPFLRTEPQNDIFKARSNFWFSLHEKRDPYPGL